MHIVTYNLNYGSLNNALAHSDGLAVLGVFFRVGFAAAFVIFLGLCSHRATSSSLWWWWWCMNGCLYVCSKLWT